MEKVTVSLGDRSYDIVVEAGCLSRAGSAVRALQPKARIFIVTDTNVKALHGAALHQAFPGAACVIAVAAGEQSKNFTTLNYIAEQLVDAGITRSDIIVAFGGGVVGDVAGFAAAVILRGVAFVQIPTTLLAQVDSSVGGKTGINLGQGKNLVGAFHQPSLVLVDPDVLSTLDPRHMRAGYTEILKMALLGDADFFEFLDTNAAELLKDSTLLRSAIIKACAMKAGIVARDETEQNERMLLNFGHTFGHAFEALAGYSDRLLHGEAVALGLVFAFRFAAARGDLAQSDVSRIIAHMQKLGLPTRLKDHFDVLPRTDDIIALMQRDKKNKDGFVRLILPERIGAAIVVPVKADDIRDFLRIELQAHA